MPSFRPLAAAILALLAGCASAPEPLGDPRRFDGRGRATSSPSPAAVTPEPDAGSPVPAASAPCYPLPTHGPTGAADPLPAANGVVPTLIPAAGAEDVPLAAPAAGCDAPVTGPTIALAFPAPVRLTAITACLNGRDGEVPVDAYVSAAGRVTLRPRAPLRPWTLYAGTLGARVDGAAPQAWTWMFATRPLPEVAATDRAGLAASEGNLIRLDGAIADATRRPGGGLLVRLAAGPTVVSAEGHPDPASLAGGTLSATGRWACGRLTASGPLHAQPPIPLGVDAFDAAAVRAAVGSHARLHGEVARSTTDGGDLILHVGRFDGGLVAFRIPGLGFPNPGDELGQAVVAEGTLSEAWGTYTLAVEDVNTFRRLPTVPPLIDVADAAAHLGRGRRIAGVVTSVTGSDAGYRLALGSSQGRPVYADVGGYGWDPRYLVGRLVAVRGAPEEDAGGIRVVVRGPAQIAVVE